jgi:hypothetical protein
VRVFRPDSMLIAALVVLAVSLLLVGVVSGTVVRHAVQVVPAVIVLGLGRRGWPRFAAMAVFAFWLLIMVLIWLYLLGITAVISGHFSAVEIVLTVVIGLASVVGIAAALRVTDASRWPVRLVAFVGGAALQVGAMCLSFHPAIATR